MKSARFATLCAAIGLVSILSFDSRAAVYSDPSNDLFDNGLSNLDITGVEITNNGVNLVIAVTTRGFQNWTKYFVWIDTPAKANAAANSHPWARPANLASGEGSDFFIGAWVDAANNNSQLWEYTTSWSTHATSPLSSVVTGNTVTFTIPLSTLGLSAGNVIKFDVATSGGGNGDPGVDHASRTTAATTAWNLASTGGPMLSYTIASLADSDSDGLADTWENTYFGNLAQIGSGDPDSDGLSNAGELTAGTNPVVADTDADGLQDGAETNNGIFVSVTDTGSNPLIADTDGDGMKDGLECGVGRYQVVLGTFTWEEARRHAISRGGNLAVITSAAEKDAIASEVTSAAMTELWLGGYQSNGTWAWVTGEAWNYTDWNGGGPSNDPTQDYLRLESFANGWDNWFLTPTYGSLPVTIRGYLLEKTQTTNPNKTNHVQITVAGGFQGSWNPAPTPANNPINVMSKITGDEFGWQLNFRMASATNYLGKFATGSWDVNWGTSGTAGVLQLGGYGNDIPFHVTATGVWRFYFNTDTRAYSFTRAAAPATFAEWAAQYGLAAGSEANDADIDGLSNGAEFVLNTDPTNDDTDGDALTDGDEVSGATSGNYFFDENFNSVSIATNPLLVDTDGDGLRDLWEILNTLNPVDDGATNPYTNFTGLAVLANPNGGSADPDADGLTNLQEQSASSNPLAAGSGFASTYGKVVVAGGFVRTKPDGSWDELGNPGNTMQLVSNFTWKLLVYLPSAPPSSAQFKFTTGSWATNFGDNIPTGGVADGVGDLNGANINALSVFTAMGYYAITFNDFSKAYTITPLATADADSDGLPDEWEAYYGGFLDPKVDDLNPSTAYVPGSSTTAAQAFAAGGHPTRDTLAPTIALAAGVDKLTWVAKNVSVTLASSDVIAADDITTSPGVTLDPATVDTAVDGLTTVTYTATDAAGNATTLTRVIAVGDVEPGWRKLHYPKNTTISTVGTAPVYGRIYLAGATPGAGQAPNISAELGVHAADTDPASWASSAWQPALHNAGFTDGDDEYSSTINGGNLAAGTYYYAFRFKIGSGAWVYAGINAAGTDGGPWDGLTNGNGVLTVNAAVLRDVTFAVDMGVQIFKGAFDPATNGVEVRATFNNFAGGVSALSREGTSSVYSGTFQVEGAEGATNNYKFFSSGTNAVGYEGGSDRQAVLTASGTPLNTGTNFFSNLTESRRITFRVDMSVQTLKGNFNTNTGTVFVAGSFNGWSSPVPLTAQGANIYAAEVLVDGALSGVEYKFVNGSTYEPNVNNRTITTVLPNLEASTLDPGLFNNDDGIGPVITLTGASTINLTVGDTYTELGATTLDAIDGSGTATPSATVDTTTVGTYTVTYNASDAAGNAATPVTRTVVVAAASGSTFTGWAGGATLDAANVGKYAIGGASSPSATDGVKPTLAVSGGNLVLTAIVRVDDPKLSVFGEVVTSLANYGTPASTTMIDGAEASDQTGVPAGHKRQTFTVPQGADTKKFLRLKATLQP